jgi:hypothetical protein
LGLNSPDDQNPHYRTPVPSEQGEVAPFPLTLPFDLDLSFAPTKGESATAQRIRNGRSGRMLCLSGSAHPTQPHIDRANPLLVRVRAPRSPDKRIRHFGAIAGESRVSWSPGLKPRVVFCGESDACATRAPAHWARPPTVRAGAARREPGSRFLSQQRC